MAFINIKDPKRRDEIVQEYIRTRDEIRERNESNKESNISREREIEERLKPIVRATEESAEKVTAALQPSTPFEFYSALVKNRDKYYSIYRQNDGSFKLGRMGIEIDGESNITISGKTFGYTSGLWDLIMLNDPPEDNYSDDELANYKEIAQLTDLVDNPRALGSRTYPKRTNKFKFLTRLLQHEGTGIILPSDINSLKERLQLVSAERAAGNIKATTPEIVAILDELLHQNYISKQEYNVVCSELGC